MRRWRDRSRWALVILLLAAWALRLPPALQNQLHPDEALYGYWGLLIGNGHDPWLARVPVYKPPLLPYLVAGVQILFGDAPFTLRIPGLVAGLLTVALTGALARGLYREDGIATLAAIVVALSPFGILFSATVFPDPLMVVLGLGTCVAAVRGRAGLAGLLAGLALAAKQSGLAWAPLGLLLVLATGTRLRGRAGRYLIWFTVALGTVLAWDAIRVWRGAESFWDVGISGYGGLRLAWPHELRVRLRGWSSLAGFLVGYPLANVLLVAGLPVLVWSALVPDRLTRRGLADVALIGFAAAYLLLHWLAAFPVWDRYLLPMVPIFGVLLARLAGGACCLAARLVAYLRGRRGKVSKPGKTWSGGALPVLAAGALLVALQASPGLSAAQSHVPVGGDHGALDGIGEIAAYVSGLPEGSVVYHHWLGWHYRYHLFRAPVYLAYWPHPSWLAQDVRAFGGGVPRYIAFPVGESTARVARALSDEGYTISEQLSTRTRTGGPSLSLYQVLPLGDS